MTSTPPPCGAVAGSARSSSSGGAFTASGSHTDSDKKNCSRCTAAAQPGHRLGPGQGRQRLVPLPRRQQPGQVLPEPPPLRHMREQVIETGPRTPPADPEQADTLSAWSSLITGFQTHQETYSHSTASALIQRTTANQA